MNSVKALLRWQRAIRCLCSLGLLISMSGCFNLPAFAPQGEALSPADSIALCEALPTLERQGPRSFRALLDTSLVTPDNESFSFRYAVAAKQPDSLRVDLLPTEGAYTLGLLVVQNGRALVIDSQEKIYSSGCEVKQVFEKFFSLRGVSPELVQALITGRMPAVRCDAVQVYRKEDGRVMLIDTQTHHAWEIAESSGRVLHVSLLDRSLLHVEARALRSYSPDEERISLEIHKPVDARAVMQVRKLTLNPEISDSLFQISPPSGYEDGGC